VKSGWLLRDGSVLSAAEVADHPREKMQGLLGRSGYEGAMLFPRTRSVHTAFMQFPLDVALLDHEMQVLVVRRLVQWRVIWPRAGGRSVLEAQAGAFERWALAVGDRLEFREGQ
jgi:uncharacterized membrane protein (UPF0127 family)